MKIQHSGKPCAKDNSHIKDFDVSGATAAENVESFVWDGLALIGRNETRYTVEPHANGGSPILVSHKDTKSQSLLFNDMLGSSLGSVENGKFSAIERSSFGELMPDASCLLPDSFGSPLTTDNRLPTTDFWTGKPKIEGLGYAFLFRNYRADVGKWMSADPLGYPDGWNNTAYCGNRVTHRIDPLGMAEARVGFRNLDMPGGFVGRHSSLLIILPPEEFEFVSKVYGKYNWVPTDDGSGNMQAWFASQNIDGYNNKTNGYYYDNPELIDYTVPVETNVSAYQFAWDFLNLYSAYPDDYINYDRTPNSSTEGNCNSFLSTLTWWAHGSINPDDIPLGAVGWGHKQAITE